MQSGQSSHEINQQRTCSTGLTSNSKQTGSSPNPEWDPSDTKWIRSNLKLFAIGQSIIITVSRIWTIIFLDPVDLFLIQLPAHH
jgi:hypothetical protein